MARAWLFYARELRERGAQAGSCASGENLRAHGHGQGKSTRAGVRAGASSETFQRFPDRAAAKGTGKGFQMDFGFQKRVGQKGFQRDFKLTEPFCTE